MRFVASFILLVSASFLAENVVSLSIESCKSYDAAKLYADATEIVKEVDSLLPSYRTASGVLVTIVDEDDGEDSGGGTNTDGSYQTFIFNGTEIFPDGICDIPTNDGNSRCDTENGGSTITYLLGPADVIAFVACSPPEMRYFSYDTIISTRLTEEYPFYPGQPFGDTISHMSINTSEIGNAFDQPILVVLSADYKAAQTVADAYISTNKISASSVSIHGIDANTVRLWDRSNGQTWQETAPDILSMVARMAVPAATAK